MIHIFLAYASHDLREGEWKGHMGIGKNTSSNLIFQRNQNNVWGGGSIKPFHKSRLFCWRLFWLKDFLPKAFLPEVFFLAGLFVAKPAWVSM